VVAVQGLCFWALALLMLMGRAPGERPTAMLVRATYLLAFLLAVVSSVAFVASGQSRALFSVGDWSVFSTYEFHFVLLVDALSIPFLLLATSLCGVVAVFSEKYLHRERGYHRYFLLLCLFGFGDSLTILAGSIEVLYASWELLGLTSALLIGFFHDRPGPVRNGLYTFVVYRISDLCLALATVTIYHLAKTGDFSTFIGVGAWPEGHCSLTAPEATTVGLLVMVAALGKAAQLPFSGWLPRAMEGPTPSTAIFYGALSVHAGAFLLLRFSTVLDAAPLVAHSVLGLGLMTAFWARVVGKAQTDAKCSLAYASLGQVGLIFAEIGLGLRVFPVIHAVSHALMRSLQFLRAPSLLHEIHELHSATGVLPHPQAGPSDWVYRLRLDHGFVENLVDRLVVVPFVAFCRMLRRVDQAVLSFLGGPE
jgi:NAD(P)H-quinone oxidoreductase subunit 5